MREYRIQFRPAAVRALQSLDKAIQRRLVKKIEALAEDPFPRGIRKMSGMENLYRLRVGNYRIVCQVVKKKLIVRAEKVEPVIDLGNIFDPERQGL